MSIARRISLLAVGIFVSVFLSVGNVLSQENQTPGGSGLSVSPTRFELTIAPGSSETVKVSIKNPNANRVVAVPVINDFVSDNETGKPQLIIDEERDDIPSIRGFFRELESFTVEPEQVVTKEIPVEIPADTAAGGYYGVIRFVATPDGNIDSEAGQVALTASIATPVLITVPGDITEQIQLRNILFYRKDIAGTFFTSQPEKIGVQILNQGNGFSQPFGTVRVKNPFGKEVQNYELNSATPRGNVLPNSSRTFQEDMSGISIPGRYTATADVSFGNGGEVLAIKKTFWYLPYWFIGLVVLLVIALVALGFVIRRKIRTGSIKKRK